tara:strand:+ start:23443 stop:23646 length:204 start_codon:yes stop_codon:yes gene_type:complete
MKIKENIFPKKIEVTIGRYRGQKGQLISITTNGEAIVILNSGELVKYEINYCNQNRTKIKIIDIEKE